MRYFDGSAWTETVSLGGRQAVDPQGAGPSAEGIAAAPTVTMPSVTQAGFPAQQTGNGMAVASLVLGLIGLLAGLVPLLFFIAFPCGVLAVVFGFVGRRNAVRRPTTGKGMAIAGLVMGVLGLVLGVVGLVVLNKAVDEIGETLDTITLETIAPVSSADPTTPETEPDVVESVPVETTTPDAAADLVVESGFSRNVERGVVSAGALVTNRGGRTACGVEVQFSLLDSAGAPVDTDTSTIPIIAPGQTLSVAPLQIGYQVADPARLEVTVVGIEDQIDSAVLADCGGFYLEKGIKIEVLNPVLNRDFGVSIDGQLSNPSDQPIDSTFIDCVFRLGGEIVGGETSMSLDPIVAGGTIAFSIGFISYEGEADEIICTALA